MPGWRHANVTRATTSARASPAPGSGLLGPAGAPALRRNLFAREEGARAGCIARLALVQHTSGTHVAGDVVLVLAGVHAAGIVDISQCNCQGVFFVERRKRRSSCRRRWSCCCGNNRGRCSCGCSSWRRWRCRRRICFRRACGQKCNACQGGDLDDAPAGE